MPQIVTTLIRRDPVAADLARRDTGDVLRRSIGFAVQSAPWRSVGLLVMAVVVGGLPVRQIQQGDPVIDACWQLHHCHAVRAARPHATPTH
jgi:hypothetical protein